MVSSSFYFWARLRPFAFTQIVEVPIYLRGLSGPRLRAFCIAFGARPFTHPLVWYLFPWLFPHSWVPGMVAAELFAWLAEAAYLLLFGLKPTRALGLSFVANAASFTLGLISRALFDTI